MYYKDVAKEFKTVVSVDLGAATQRMRMSRFAPGFQLKHAGDVVLPLDTLHTNVAYISPEEALAGPKSLLEASVSTPLDGIVDSAPVFCPNAACGLARRPWPSTATISSLCRTRLVPRASIVAEELVGPALGRAIFEMQRSTKRKVQPDTVLASTPIDWSADIRYRYLDFLKTSFAGAEVRLVDDPQAIARDAFDCPDIWDLVGGGRLTGIFPNERVLVLDSGARRTQFYTAASSPRIGFFDPSYAALMWGGADCDHLIAAAVADHLQVESDPATLREWTRPIRLWKETLSASIGIPERTVLPLHLPIGHETGESIAVGPPSGETATILAAIEQKIYEIVEHGLQGLGVGLKYDVVLLAGGNAR